jgi:hypothetical protein
VDVNFLVQKYPTLYHMAEAGTWPSIKTLGLLSTEALLHHLRASEREHDEILGMHRPCGIKHRGVLIRDQKPMNHNLKSCLRPANINPEQWFRFLNRKVFFWATPERLQTFCKVYRARPQLIIEVPTERMLREHRDKITLCHINSGATRMPNHYRSFETFQSIETYPTERKLAEFTVDWAVKDIATLASQVYENRDQQKVLLYSN